MIPGARVRIAHDPYGLDRCVSGASGELVALDEGREYALVRLDDPALSPFAPRRCPVTGRPVALVFPWNLIHTEQPS